MASHARPSIRCSAVVGWVWSARVGGLSLRWHTEGLGNIIKNHHNIQFNWQHIRVYQELFVKAIDLGRLAGLTWPLIKLHNIPMTPKQKSKLWDTRSLCPSF